MNKLILKAAFFLTLLAHGVAYALPPSAPVLNLERKGLQVSANWEKDTSATGYNLYYAPYPNMGQPEMLDMGEENSLSVNLANGAAYYVWVKAYNADGESLSSNIEYFIINNKVIAFLPDPALNYTSGTELKAGLEEAFAEMPMATLETVFVDPNDAQALKDLYFGSKKEAEEDPTDASVLDTIPGYAADPDVIAVVTATTGQTLALTSQSLDNPPLIISCTGTATKLKALDNIVSLPADNFQQADLLFNTIDDVAYNQSQHLTYAILINRQAGMSFYAYDLYSYLLVYGLVTETEVAKYQGLKEDDSQQGFAQLVGTFMYDSSSEEEKANALNLLDKVQPTAVIHIGNGSDLPYFADARPNMIWAGSDSSYAFETYKDKTNTYVVSLTGSMQNYGYDAGGFLNEIFDTLSASLISREGILGASKYVTYQGRTGLKGFDTGDDSGTYELLYPGEQDWVKIADSSEAAADASEAVE